MIKKTFLVFMLVITIVTLNACTKTLSINIRLSPMDTTSNVRGNITLDTEYQGETIVWTSSNETVISVTGVVVRPSVTSSSESVTLTATVSEGSKSFKLTVTPLTGNALYDEYPSMDDPNHILRSIDYTALMALFSSTGSKVVFLGWPTCPWCKEYIYYFNDLAKQQNIPEILYYNFQTIRNNYTTVDGKITLSAEFQALVDQIDPSFLKTNPTDPDTPWLFAPTILVFNEGVVVGSFSGAVTDHVAYLSLMNEAQKLELILTITQLYNLY